MGFEEINNEMDKLVRQEILRERIGCIIISFGFIILTITSIALLTLLFCNP